MTNDARRVGVRESAPEDAEFLLDLLLDEINAASAEPVTRKQFLRDRTLAGYVAGWQREGDLGVVAVDMDGPAGLQIPIGAAWVRRFSATAPGRGFIDESVPEVSLGVVPAERELGVEGGLLRALVTRARDAGVERMSTVLEHGHLSAQALEALGFRLVRSTEAAQVYVIEVPDPE